MSIFKATFPPYVSRQLLARQHLLQDGSSPDKAERTRNVQHYTSGKTAWARMISLVDYDLHGNGNFTDELARKYVLQAGTLYSDSKDVNKFTMRSGVATARGSYGGDLGARTEGNKVQRPLGYRSMPGIVQIDTVNKGAFGSLRQSTIKFKAWDKPQLDDLEVLFMRPGYWVVLEWGWSMYIDTYKQEDSAKSKPDVGTLSVGTDELNRYINKQMHTFNDPTLNPFDAGLNLETILDKIEEFRYKFSGNYDGILGRIENFTFELMPDGSYDCTTVLISIGDVLDSLKMNRPARDDKQDQELVDGYKTNFAKTMTDFINLEPDSFIATVLGGEKPPEGVSVNTSVDIGNRIQLTNTGGATSSTAAGNNTKNDSDVITYIQFGYLIHILNVKHNYYDTKGNKLVNIQIPLPTPEDKNRGLCLSSVDSVSIDPLKVLIHNPKATFVTGLEGGFDVNKVLNHYGSRAVTSIPVRPEFTSDTNYIWFSGEFITRESLGGTFAFAGLNDFLVEGEPEGHTLGYIGNIYVSVQRLKDLFEDMISRQGSDARGSVSVYSFLREVLKDMSYALGSINDFDLSPQDNTVYIIDKNYCERAKDTAKSSKFMLNIYGNNALTRAFKIHSKIFQSQATEIAIGAQYTSNLGSVYTATQRQFNQYLKPRIYYKLTTEEDRNPPQSTKEEADQKVLESLAGDVITLRRYLQSFLQTPAKFPSETSVSTANTYLRTALLQINIDSNFRAPIPLSLEVTLDGISGMVIGQIFTVNTDILPQDYARNALGFMVTNLSHHIKGSDWTTVVGTKPVLLNQEKLGNPKGVSDLKSKVGLTINKVENNTLLDAMASVRAYLRVMSFIKLYFDQVFNISVLITRDLPEAEVVSDDINDSKSIDKSIHPTVKVSLSNQNMLVTHKVATSPIFVNKVDSGNSVTYDTIRPLLSDVMLAIYNKIDMESTIRTFIDKGTKPSKASRVDTTDSQGAKRRINSQPSSLRLLSLADSVSDTYSFLKSIIYNIPDYTKLPSELRSKVDAKISDVEIKSGKTTVVGITIKQGTDNTITYIEDASQGQMEISDSTSNK